MSGEGQLTVGWMFGNRRVKGKPLRHGEVKQEAQLSLTNRPTLVHTDVKISLTKKATKHSFPCCAARSCSLVNDCDLLAGFS